MNQWSVKESSIHFPPWCVGIELCFIEWLFCINIAFLFVDVCEKSAHYFINYFTEETTDTKDESFGEDTIGGEQTDGNVKETPDETDEKKEESNDMEGEKVETDESSKSETETNDSEKEAVDELPKTELWAQSHKKAYGDATILNGKHAQNNSDKS